VEFIGIDLAGSEKRNTGFCTLRNSNAITKILNTNEEIIEKVKESNAKIVAIDATIVLHFGRKNLEEKSNVHLREYDKQLLYMYIKLFQMSLEQMRM